MKNDHSIALSWPQNRTARRVVSKTRLEFGVWPKSHIHRVTERLRYFAFRILRLIVIWLTDELPDPADKSAGRCGHCKTGQSRRWLFGLASEKPVTAELAANYLS
jgi:hypothetical protein